MEEDSGSERASSAVCLGRGFVGCCVGHRETCTCGQRRKAWEVLGRKLVFGQLWGPLDDFEQNGTRCSFQKIIWS